MTESKEQLKVERDKIVKGLEETYRKLIEFKKRINSPMVVIRDGEVVEIDAHELEPTVVYKRS